MSQIKGKNTKPEELVRKFLFSQGFRYIKNDRRLPGTPDIVLPKYKTVIFVNGCFWHGYDWENRKPKLKTNREYWIEKIEENITRDARNDKLLLKMGWIPIHFWEKEVNKSFEECIKKIEFECR